MITITFINKNFERIFMNEKQRLETKKEVLKEKILLALRGVNNGDFFAMAQELSETVAKLENINNQEVGA